MKVSILTPSFNSANYLPRAIASVLAQDYTNWEHVIVDGGSTDNTLEILNSHPHLKWVSEKDKGQSDAMNKAFRLSSGDIIVYLNADDELSPGLLSVIVNQFRVNPNIDLLVGDLLIDRMGKRNVAYPSVSLPVILQYQKFKYPLNPVSYAYKRKLQLAIGDFPINNHYSMDYWFLLRAYRIGRVVKINYTCGIYHVDGNNKSSNAERSLKSLIRVRRAFLLKYVYSPVVAFYLIRMIPGMSFMESFLKSKMK